MFTIHTSDAAFSVALARIASIGWDVDMQAQAINPAREAARAASTYRADCSPDVPRKFCASCQQADRDLDAWLDVLDAEMMAEGT